MQTLSSSRTGEDLFLCDHFTVDYHSLQYPMFFANGHGPPLILSSCLGVVYPRACRNMARLQPKTLLPICGTRIARDMRDRERRGLSRGLYFMC